MKKILIDLTKLRDYEKLPSDGVLYNKGEGLRTLREEATFEFTCRKCEDAPCINVCPAEALEKDPTGRVIRHVNLCVRCKSCITICPFGTLMDDLFEKKERARMYNLNDERELKNFLHACPAEAVSVYEGEADPAKHIHKLNERVLVKEFIWKA